MNKTIFCLLLIAAPVLSWAQKAYVAGDTIYVDNKRKEVPQDEASLYGVVQQVNPQTNTATIRFFRLEDNQLKSLEHRVATGENQGLKNGEQLFFDSNGNVSSMQQFTLVYDERKGKMRSRMMEETLLYSDGKTQEYITFSYETTEKGEQRSYDRKYYYPDGKTLQYREQWANKQQTINYYDENGKETFTPQQEVPLYETMPAFRGGKDALFEYLSNNTRYPDEAKQRHIEGRVIVEFTVDKDGSIQNVKVKKSGGHPSLDKEAVRVVSMMPQWHPGTLRGKPVRVKYTVPVNFHFD